MSIPKISYLFGAGASALALPTIKQMPDRILSAMDYLHENYIFDETEKVRLNEEIPRNAARDFLCEELYWLAQHAKGSSTIDTYAKQLFINGNYAQKDRLIFAMALYFSVEQKKSGVDPRYITFLISLLQTHGHSFPNNVKFFTWNYDLQLEAAHEIITGNNPNFNLSTFRTGEYDRKIERFTSVKLNGSCIFRQADQLNPLLRGMNSKEFQNDDLDVAMTVGYGSQKLKKDFYPNGDIDINFAWNRHPVTIAGFTELHKETNILVVIGYSFPFFNRNVDRAIIRGMANLKKIYIQDLHPEDIQSKFLSILPDWEDRGIKIISVKDVSEFFLPPEL